MTHPAHITSIIVQKNNKRRFNVFIDEEFRFSVGYTIALTLRPGDVLSPSRIEEIKSADQQEQAYEKSLHYLKFRPRSRQEVVRYLEEKGFAEKAVETTLKRLEFFRYIDDEAFSRFWIDSRERHRPRGEFALRFELKAKGIPDVIIDDMLSGYEETEPAWRAIYPKLRAWKPGDAFELKKKIHAFLNRRGFTYSTCETVFERAVQWMAEHP